jgi:large subunit ribosomal protein L29
MSNDELTKRLVETRKELFNLRFQSATGSLDNPSRLKLTRQEIARILTVQLERSAQDQKVAS